ncbi:hypothetical protein EB796_008656 [Bugula neritina]|uniref:Protein Wnt n=1 Tax=Bugula neritina TaxID=10212 RepID=A0A7J7K4J2_BUGNE|nr:hypothetical protein EB796_008656 [Bugula neritina]
MLYSSKRKDLLTFNMAAVQLWITYAILLCTPTVQSLKWLSLASIPSSLSESQMEGIEDLCSRLTGLERRQKKVCRQHISMMSGVMNGANMSIIECQNQFKDRRWNCSMVDEHTIFGDIVNKGTREAAYIHAITAAGVSFAVTKGCSRGELSGCGCDVSKVGEMNGFTWAGCSDNALYGTAFSKKFTDARERVKNTNGRSLMNLHNNQAGREVVLKNMKTECKCHGVSGSCEVKTCWRSLPSFKQVGQILKQSFDGATEVKSKKKSQVGRMQLIPSSRKLKPFEVDDLVYLKDSPDFCEKNSTLGSLGTHGRECNKTSKNIDGCDLMCCGRGYRTIIEHVTDRCNCKFYWCCFVKCEECIKRVVRNICL